MSATYDLTKALQDYNFSQSTTNTPVQVVHARFSGPQMTIKKGSAIVTNDVFQLITVPAGAFVNKVHVKVETAEGATCTFDIGDGSTTDGYLDGVEGNALTETQSFTADTTEAYGAGKLYTTADTIDLKLMTGTAANLIVDVSAEITLLRK